MYWLEYVQLCYNRQQSDPIYLVSNLFSDWPIMPQTKHFTFLLTMKWGKLWVVSFRKGGNLNWVSCHSNLVCEPNLVGGGFSSINSELLSLLLYAEPETVSCPHLFSLYHTEAYHIYLKQNLLFFWIHHLTISLIQNKRFLFSNNVIHIHSLTSILFFLNLGLEKAESIESSGVRLSVPNLLLKW